MLQIGRGRDERHRAWAQRQPYTASTPGQVEPGVQAGALCQWQRGDFAAANAAFRVVADYRVGAEE